MFFSLAGCNTTEALTLAAAARAKQSPGKKDLGAVIKKASIDPKKARKSLDTSDPIKMKISEGLALKVATDLSDSQYQMLRNSSIKHNANIYPTLHEIAIAKKECYPDDIEFTETSAKCKVQNMINHTLNRILSIDNLKTQLHDVNTCKFYLKIGMDGASSQSIYMQKFEDTELVDGVANEESLFHTAISPLKLVSGEKTIWSNPKPNSIHFCRPLHLQYAKETTEVTTNEERRLREEIEALEPFKVTVSEDHVVLIDYDIQITMVDGKVVNALTDQRSTQSCNICKAKPSEMNGDLQTLHEKQVDNDAMSYGLSPLHCTIRGFEYILHLGYRMEIKKHQVRAGDKEKVKERKEKIQKNFRERLGLVVDMPKVGFGNTNTGNLARRAFANAEQFSEITGVEEELS